jgi:hypothetical protein
LYLENKGRSESGPILTFLAITWPKMDDEKINDKPFDCALKRLFNEIKFIFLNCIDS